MLNGSRCVSLVLNGSRRSSPAAYRGRVACKKGFSGDVTGRECLGNRIRAAARINVGGRAYYCGREAELLRPPDRIRFLYLIFLQESDDGIADAGETELGGINLGNGNPESLSSVVSGFDGRDGAVHPR